MILLTGASGFIGKRLLKSLIGKYGAENILALTSHPVSECHFLLHNNYQFENDFFYVNGFENISTVIHAGAFTPKNRGLANDATLCFSNITSTFKLLTALPPTLKKIIFLSAVDIYESEEPIDEQSKIIPISLYAHSKYYCENMITAWGVANDIQIQILRIGHVYGPGEEGYDKIIPRTIKRILDGRAPQILGDGNEIRSFIYIDDLVSCICNAIHLDRNPGPINIAGSRSISIRDLIYQILGISKASLDIEFIDSKTTSRSLIFDNSKMKYFLGDESVTLAMGLQEEFNYMSTLKESVL